MRGAPEAGPNLRGLTARVRGYKFPFAAIVPFLNPKSVFDMDKDILFDTRLVNRWISKKVITEAEYRAQLESLRDAAENADNIEASSVDHVGESAAND